MNKSQALKEAVKRWGKDAVVMDERRNASTPEERTAAREELQRLLKTLSSDEKRRRRHELDDLLYRALRQRFKVGVHGGFFIGIRGYGDTWEECFEVADKMWGKKAA